ncbi:DUF4129 domain-containing protein [Microbacterium fluvii]|uniref:DUF4129 domain-containing protein n=1 Tax=Microbacterium fluvii TaxID=415215 RepID=A0ABW2HAD8_9MICO|nr:DUF4129 domain-containing protein [Microbacterium fluvii]MCU4671454.1 DUF4129 domain-containing protein [Microbacterium fluvii]
MGLIAVSVALATPLVPDGDEARSWAEQELRDPVYATAEPTAFDRVARAVGEFFAALFSPQVPTGWGPALAVVAAVVVVVVIAAAFVIWGVPRATVRARAATADLFGDAEQRTADQLRAAAAAAADAARWDEAIVLRFRALARSLDERGIVTTPPGATVHAFARAAARAFPAAGDELEAAASAFDDVRYLRRPGTAQLHALVARVDDRLARARPAGAEPLAAPA